MTRYDTLRDRLRKRRLELGWSINEAADRMGIAASSYSRLENGMNPNPTLDTVYHWCRALGMSMILDAEPWMASDRSSGY